MSNYDVHMLSTIGVTIRNPYTHRVDQPKEGDMRQFVGGREERFTNGEWIKWTKWSNVKRVLGKL